MTDKAQRPRLDEILVKEGIISEDQIKEALSRQKTQGGKFGSQLLLSGFIDEAGLVKALATQFHCDGVVLSKLDIPEIILKFIPRRLAIARKIIPFDYDLDENLLKIACEDPRDDSLISEINFVARGKNIKLFVAAELALNAAIARFYMGKDVSKNGLLLELPRPTADTGRIKTEAEQKQPEHDDQEPDTETVLLVTDDPDEGSIIRSLLERGGYEVVTVDSADAAIELAGSRRFQTVFIKDSVSGDYLDLIDRLRKSSPRTLVRYFESAASLLLDDASYRFEEDLLYRDLELFTCLLASREGHPRNLGGILGPYVDKLCRRLGIPTKDRLTIINAAYIHDISRYYYRIGKATDHRQTVDLTVKLLESLDYSPVVIAILRSMYADVSGKYSMRLPIEALGANILTVVDVFCDIAASEQRLSLDKLDATQKKLQEMVGKSLLPEIVDAFVAMLKDEILRFHTEQKVGQTMILADPPERIAAIEPHLKNEGFRVIAAEGIDQFIELYRRSLPDVIVLMPGGGLPGARELVESLVQREIDFKGIPTVVLVDNPCDLDLISIFDLGIEDVITADRNIYLLVTKMRWVRRRLLAKAREAADSQTDTGRREGDLKGSDLVDLLRGLNTEGETVKLAITNASDGPGELVLCLHHGEIVFAKQGDLFGAEAVYSAAEWKHAHWSVEPLKESDLPDTNVREPFEDILVECCRIIDSRSGKEQPA